MDLQILSKSKLHKTKNCEMVASLGKELRQHIQGAKKKELETWGRDIKDAFTKQLRRLPDCEQCSVGLICLVAGQKTAVLKLSGRNYPEDVIVFLLLGLVDPDSKQHTFVNTRIADTKQVFRALYKFNPSSPLPPLVEKSAFTEKGDTLKKRKQFDQNSSGLTPLSELIFERGDDDVKSEEDETRPTNPVIQLGPPSAEPTSAPDPFRKKGDTLKGRRKVQDIEAEPLGALFSTPDSAQATTLTLDSDEEFKLDDNDQASIPLSSSGKKKAELGRQPSFGSTELIETREDKVSSMPVFPTQSAQKKKAFTKRGDTLRNLREAKGKIDVSFTRKPLTALPIGEALKETETVETTVGKAETKEEEEEFFDV